jgi:hypothetical protein
MTTKEAMDRLRKTILSKGFESPEHFYAFMMATREDLFAKTGLWVEMEDGILHVKMPKSSGDA